VCGYAIAGGCATKSPLPDGAFIRAPIAPPQLSPPPKPAGLPAPPVVPAAGTKPVAPRPGDPNGPLALGEVLNSVDAAFPLLYAVEQERAIAAGQRLAAESPVDLEV